MSLKIITVPGAEELASRLIAVDSEPHLQERFYPLLMKTAGQPRSGEGIVIALMLAVSDYTQGQPPIMATLMHMRLHQFLGAFTDDEEVLAIASAHLNAAGLPNG